LVVTTFTAADLNPGGLKLVGESSHYKPISLLLVGSKPKDNLRIIVLLRARIHHCAQKRLRYEFLFTGICTASIFFSNRRIFSFQPIIDLSN
jgi:hypothetical protein